ncbi:MAG: type II toxin-antitoxin system prevent-host-death family antitoxin [Kiritimatiellae bacterium]|nr:type II toxin-antitoxin system prevent-host-death family antitoxin [Kiritimatiellia bacterium]
MSMLTVSKSVFKTKAFAYLRRVENGDRVCITDHGRPVVDLVPHREAQDRELKELRGLVLKYDRPMDPVDEKWEADT